MWALLDIRTGRANRAQFFVLTLMIFFALYYISFFEHPYLMWLTLSITLYLFFLVYVRRYRDTLSDPREEYTTLQALKTLISSFFALLFFAVTLPYIILTLLNFNSGILRSNSWPFNILDEHLISPFTIVLFKSSAPYLTSHGLPPLGLNFLTMTYKTYPEKLRKRASEASRAYEADVERQNEEESEGVEALVARQAGKAARRKRYLFTEEYHVDDV